MILENLKMAVESIKANRMRSFLTMLGIIIGIMSVIIILSAGTGAKNSMLAYAEEIGATTINLMITGHADVGDYFTDEDLTALGELPGVAAVTPLVNSYGNFEYGRSSNFGYIYGCAPGFRAIQGVQMVSGRFFNEDEYNAERPVIVIDEPTAIRFFGSTDVAGLEIDVTSYTRDHPISTKARIVGVCKNPNANVFYEGMNTTSYMPCSLVNRLFYEGDMTIGDVYLKVADPAEKETIAATALSLVEARHNARGPVRYAVPGGRDQPDDRDDPDLCGCGCRHQPAGGGHWGDEHYAGIGERAHPGDRHPQIPGGKNRGDPPAVFDRGRHPLPLRGPDRAGAGVPGQLRHLCPGRGGARL